MSWKFGLGANAAVSPYARFVARKNPPSTKGKPFDDDPKGTSPVAWLAVMSECVLSAHALSITVEAMSVRLRVTRRLAVAVKFCVWMMLGRLSHAWLSVYDPVMPVPNGPGYTGVYSEPPA